MKARFLLDEHIDHAIRRQLQRRDPSIEVIVMGGADAPPLGTQDPDILSWLEANEYVLVTGDRSTMPVHLAGHLAAGKRAPCVIWIRPNASIGDVIESLYYIWTAATAEELRERIYFIPF
jgi:predicted nuclease of predicted toxin-antitoxin system